MKLVLCLSLICAGCCDDRPLWPEAPNTKHEYTYKIVLTYQEGVHWKTTLENDNGTRHTVDGQLGKPGEEIQIWDVDR